MLLSIPLFKISRTGDSTISWFYLFFPLGSHPIKWKGISQCNPEVLLSCYSHSCTGSQYRKCKIVFTCQRACWRQGGRGSFGQGEGRTRERLGLGGGGIGDGGACNIQTSSSSTNRRARAFPFVVSCNRCLLEQASLAHWWGNDKGGWSKLGRGWNWGAYLPFLT